jgi:hypothetical protein
VQSGPQSVAKAMKRTGVSAAPIILIVRNEGESPLEPEALASTDYRLLNAAPTTAASSPGGGPIVLAAAAPGSRISFVPHPTAAFDAKISVERNGTIQSQNVACPNEGGGTVIVDPAAAVPVHSTCDTIAECETAFSLTFVPAGATPPRLTTSYFDGCAVALNVKTVDEVKTTSSGCGLSDRLEGPIDRIECVVKQLCGGPPPLSYYEPASFAQLIVNQRGNICHAPNINP